MGLSPDLLCIAGYYGYFKRVNPAVVETLGYSVEELLASPINSFVHPDDRELTSRKMAALFEGKSPLRFQNRYLTKHGGVVSLFWTSVRIDRDKLVFAIAKDISKMRLEKSNLVSDMLDKMDTYQMRRFNADIELIRPAITHDSSSLNCMGIAAKIDNRDQLWLNRFEKVVRQHVGSININLAMISSELAISERQLFRQVKRIMQMTPSQLVSIIRFHIAWEAIASKRHLGLDEIASIAGYASQKHFKKTFAKTFGIDVMN